MAAIAEPLTAYDTDPFPLILDAHIQGHITDEERYALFDHFYPGWDADDGPVQYVRPRGQAVVKQWMSLERQRIADRLEELIERAEGEAVGKPEIRGPAPTQNRSSGPARERQRAGGDGTLDLALASNRPDRTRAPSERTATGRSIRRSLRAP